MFLSIAQRLETHIADAEKRYRCFETEAKGMKREMRTGLQRSEAAAKWWWKEYCSLKDAVMSLIDGKIRHHYDRAKAVRTPNAPGIHWQKASLRTGESQDNLRALLQKEGRKGAGVYDALNRRIEDLQDSVKRFRSSLVLEVRAVRVSGFGEETQELRLLRRGSGVASSSELRLRPPCGYSLEECTCGQVSSPPEPVREGSLAAAVKSAREAVAASAAAGSRAALGETSADRAQKNAPHACDGRNSLAIGKSAREGGKKRRVVEDDDEECNLVGQRGVQGSDAGASSKKVRSFRPGLGTTDASELAGGAHSGETSSSLDEIKRQMGKNPLELERRKEALDEEIRAAEGGRRVFVEGQRGAVDAVREDSTGEATKPADEGVGEDTDNDGGDDPRHRLAGMAPHERAEWFEECGRYQEALMWHRQDLAAARRRSLDGEVEDERDLVLDVARALRNTGRCLGRLGMTDFEEAKKHLMEACELVGPGGPFPSPVEEQDVVLELGNLWYHRYLLLAEKGIKFLADEALASAVRRYEDSRELCVDLVADTNEDSNAGRDGGTGSSYSGPFTVEGEACSSTLSRKGLLRAEFNVGMGMVEQGKHADAISHLEAVGDGFRKLARSVAVTNPLKDDHSAGGSVGQRSGGGQGTNLVRLDSWGTSLERDGMSDSGELYASSLSLLGECMASIPSHSRAALGVLKASVQAFIAIGDPASAIEPLERLVDVVHGEHRGDMAEWQQRCLTTESLCESTTVALHKKKGDGSECPSGGGVGAGSAKVKDELDNALSEMDHIRRRVEDLWVRDVAGEERYHAGAKSNGEGEVRTGGCVRQPPPQQHKKPRAGHDIDAQHGAVGPPLSKSFRRRIRPLKALLPPAPVSVGEGRRSAREGATAQSSRNVLPPPSERSAGGTRNALTSHPDPAHAGVRRNRSAAPGCSNANVAALPPRQVAGFHRQGRQGSFAELRAAVEAATAAADRVRAVKAPFERSAVTGERDGQMIGRVQERQGCVSTAYVNLCSFLNVTPNARASARLLLAQRPSGVREDFEPAARVSKCLGKSTNSESIPVLDLRACGLLDRDLQAILHALALVQGSGEADRETLGVPETKEYEEAIWDSPPSPALFYALLLGDNPRIGLRSVEALWGFGGGGVSRGREHPTGLLRYLQRVDLSRCGLTAADLAGFSTEGWAGDRLPAGTPSTVPLRALVLRDNPLTRVGAINETADLEGARQGTAGLRELIARAPALETLDISGCSQLPEGPTSRLYSPKIAELLASAIAVGLQARVNARVSGDRMTASQGDDGDVQTQVATVRLGNNRFSFWSWVQVIQALSSRPPRELDLSFCISFPTTTEAMASGSVPSTLSSASESAGLPEEAEKWIDDNAFGGGPQTRPLLSELLALTILPADAPGVQILDLSGSSGFLPPVDRPRLCGPREGARAEGDDGVIAPCPSSSSTEAFFVNVRDALMSPLCRTVRLSLSGARGPRLQGLGASTSTVGSQVLGPKYVKVLCEAASACSSLRFLDLGGSDLSGSLGATAAAAAVKCLIRKGIDGVLHPRGEDHDGNGEGRADAVQGDDATDPGLSRLSLRACRLGVVGLSSIVSSLAAVFVSNAEEGLTTVARHCHRPSPSQSESWFVPRIPHLLDLSDNRPPNATPLSVDSQRGVNPDVVPDRLEEGKAHVFPAGTGDVFKKEERDSALRTLSASLGELKRLGLASVVTSSSLHGRSSARCLTADGGNQGKGGLVNLSGNRLVLNDSEEVDAFDGGIAFIVS